MIIPKSTSKSSTKNKFTLQDDTQKTILSTPVMNVISGNVQCNRNGVVKEFYRLDFPAWVNIVAITPEQEILLINQYRFGSDQNEWEIPGGAVDTGEDPLVAGIRELREETGYEGERARIIGKVCPNPALQDNACYTVLVENVVQVAEPDPDEMEDIDSCTVPVSEILDHVKDGTINHGLVLNGLMFYLLATGQIFA